MVEKRCRLNLHKAPLVLVPKGARRIHIIGSEHGESVTIVGCASAIENEIHPMVLYNGKCMKPEYADNLPPNSICAMTPEAL